MSITLDQATRIIQACQDKAISMNIHVAIAVVDARGDLVSACRMDGSMWWWIETCRGKALASATYGVPSVELLDRLNRPTTWTMIAIHDGRMTPAQGAVPIIKDGIMIGAVGIGGGTGEQDEEIAISGAKAIQGSSA